MKHAPLVYVGLAAIALGALWIAMKPATNDAPATASSTSTSAASPAPGTPAPSTGVGSIAAGAATSSADTKASTTSSLPPATPRVFDLTIKRGRIVEGPEVIKVAEGEEVRLDFTSDAPGEVHLHGYDLHVALQPNATVSLSFVAKLTGRFGFELHKSSSAHGDLGAVEVYPR